MFEWKEQQSIGPIFDVYVDGRPIGRIWRYAGEWMMAKIGNDGSFVTDNRQFKLKEKAAEALWIS